MADRNPLSLARVILVTVFASVLLGGCTSLATLDSKHAQRIASISVVVNFILTTDAAGTVDTVDVPACKEAASKIAEAVSEALQTRGYTVADNHIIISRPRRLTHKQRVIENEGHRQLAIEQLEIRRGLLYSENISEELLSRLYKSSRDIRSIRWPEGTPLSGDAVLFLSLDGRVTGVDKKVSKGILNVGTALLQVVGMALTGSGGSVQTINTRDHYKFNMGMFMAKNGALLLKDKSDVKMANTNVVEFTVSKVRNTIPNRGSGERGSSPDSHL